eukprot:IDg5099t1
MDHLAVVILVLIMVVEGILNSEADAGRVSLDATVEQTENHALDTAEMNALLSVPRRSGSLKRSPEPVEAARTVAGEDPGSQQQVMERQEATELFALDKK